MAGWTLSTEPSLSLRTSGIMTESSHRGPGERGHGAGRREASQGIQSNIFLSKRLARQHARALRPKGGKAEKQPASPGPRGTTNASPAPAGRVSGS